MECELRSRSQVQELRWKSCSRGQGVGVTDCKLRSWSRNRGLPKSFWIMSVVFFLQMTDFDNLDVFCIMDLELFFQLPIIGGEKFLHIWNQQHHMSLDS